MSPQSVELISQLERIQRRASKYILGLPFLCETSYESRLQKLNLLPISYWHEYLDMMFLFKASRGVINLPSSVLPILSQSVRTTRSVQLNFLQFHTKKCNTTTYQQSYTVRSTRIWNTLPEHIINSSNPIFKKHKTFSVFIYSYNCISIRKNVLYFFYNIAQTTLTEEWGKFSVLT